MDETYYYSQGRRIPILRCRSARVVRLPEGRDFVSVPGWHSVPIGQNRFQLLVWASAIAERDLQVFRLEDLRDKLLAIDRETPDPPAPVDRSLAEELGEHGSPVLLGKEGGLFLPTGEVVAKFKPEMDQAAVQRKVQSVGARIVRVLSFLPNTYLLESTVGGDGLELANTLVEDGAVEFANPNFIEEMPWRATSTPPNALFSQQWHLRNVGQNGARPKADVQALDAWRITTGSPEITICILDSGVDSKHEAFSSPKKLVPGFDFEDGDLQPDPTASSHGTSCAGVAAAPWGTGKVVGIAPDCQLMPIRRGTLSEHLKMAEAFAWAVDHGADVISCSFGYDHRPWVLPDIVRAVIDRAVEKGRKGRGCVIVWAAGNGNESISTDEWASNDKVIAVGASTDQDVRAPYSDFGPELDVCAPSSGGNNGITTTSNGGYTAQFGGTSSAAPLVAGIAGLLLSVNPNLRWNEVRDILRQSADKVDAANGRYDVNGHSDWYGYGRVNAHQALNAISILAEAARNSDVEPRVPLIREFAEQMLLSRSSGQSILRFLEGKKFRILELLRTSPTFRRDAVMVLRATADIYLAIKTGGNPVISDATWEAVTAIAPLLLSESADNSEKRTVKKEETTMTERTTTDLDAVLNRLAEILRDAKPAQAGPTSSSTDATGGGSGSSSSETTSILKRLDEQAALVNMCMQALRLPPLTSESVHRIDDQIDQFPNLLLAIKKRPYLVRQLKADGKSMRDAIESGRSVSDPELEALTVGYLPPSSGERIVEEIGLALAIGYLAYAVAQEAGRAAHVFIHGSDRALNAPESSTERLLIPEEEPWWPWPPIPWPPFPRGPWPTFPSERSVAPDALGNMPFDISAFLEVAYLRFDYRWLISTRTEMLAQMLQQRLEVRAIFEELTGIDKEARTLTRGQWLNVLAVGAVLGPVAGVLAHGVFSGWNEEHEKATGGG